MAAWGPAAAAPLLRGSRRLPLWHCAHRMFASQTEGELKVTQVLKEKFPRATVIQVTDISGTKRRDQGHAWPSDIHLCPQVLTAPRLRDCSRLRPECTSLTTIFQKNPCPPPKISFCS
ncbi:bolA-like protein 3 isoform X2 [Apodemus sylvaticus]|uniref:bolA-like protein 3 isoform X2 n=1 Tax=Apodemus sylvaticus TaxID=10129 RepID=UPI002243F48E|nr:bolA-like protein 3 isoform X2 [Apodemus sylvaticus]